jgi:hypothetical protein
VNIYSINGKQRKQKKFYINMISASKPEVVHNEDIRTKLKQLRDGIGYYENSSGNRNASYIGNESTTIETNPSSRNNNSSVLLPELKGSISPGGGGSLHY